MCTPPPNGRNAVSLSQRLFICRCGVPGRVTDLIDVLGDETDDPSEAVSFVVELGCGGWLCEKMADYETVVTQ